MAVGTSQKSGKNHRSIWVLFVLLLVVAGGNMVWRLTRGEDRIPWRTDMAAARAEAREGNKPMLLYFTASWCGPCQTLRHTTFADQKVESALGDYVPVKIDIDQFQDLALRYRVEAVPYFVLQGADDQPMKVMTGAMGSDDFLKWLRG